VEDPKDDGGDQSSDDGRDDRYPAKFGVPQPRGEGHQAEGGDDVEDKEYVEEFEPMIGHKHDGNVDDEGKDTRPPYWLSDQEIRSFWGEEETKGQKEE